MLPNAIVGLFAAAGISAWVFAKMQRQNGGNTQSSLIVAASAALLAFLFVVTLMSYLPEQT
jgi:hypothetical protein